MALFSRKKKEEEVQLEAATSTAKKQALPTDRDLKAVIIGPRLTEKTVAMGDRNVYTFTVRRDATKSTVKAAIKELYAVTPVQVNIVNKWPAKRLSGSKNRLVHVSGYKKAYVYLKKGDTINLV